MFTHESDGKRTNTEGADLGGPSAPELADAQDYLGRLLNQLQDDDNKKRIDYEKNYITCAVKIASQDPNRPVNCYVFDLVADSEVCVDIGQYSHLQLQFANLGVSGVVRDTVFDDLSEKSFSLTCKVPRGSISKLQSLQAKEYTGTVKLSYDSTTYHRQVTALQLLLHKLKSSETLSNFEMQLLIMATNQHTSGNLQAPVPPEDFPELPQLNKDQTAALLSALVNHLTILLAPAGTGKTVVSVQAGICHVVKAIAENNNSPDHPRRHVAAFFATNKACVDYADKVHQYLNAISSAAILTIVQSKTEEATNQDAPEFTLCNRVMSRMMHPEVGDSECLHWNWLHQHSQGVSLSELTEYEQQYALAEQDILSTSDFLCSTLPCAGDEKMKMFTGKVCAGIFEEFGKVSMPDCALALPLLRPDALILTVGDTQQLGPYCKYEEFDLLSESCLDRLVKYNSPLKLSEELRMPPPITNFVSGQFYNAELVTPLAGFQPRLPNPSWHRWYNCDLSLVWLHTKARDIYKRGNSLVNPAEIDLAIGFLEYLLAAGIVGGTYMIITPYIAHRDVALVQVKERLGDYPAVIEVCTIDGSQGKEADVCIICTTRPSTEFSTFFSDPRRQNVALTRGRLQTITIGNAEVHRNGGDAFGELARQLTNADLVFSGQAFPLRRQHTWKQLEPSICYGSFFKQMEYDVNLQHKEVEKHLQKLAVDARTALGDVFSHSGSAHGLIPGSPVSGEKAHSFAPPPPAFSVPVSPQGTSGLSAKRKRSDNPTSATSSTDLSGVADRDRALHNLRLTAEKKVKIFCAARCIGNECRFDHLSAKRPVCLEEVLDIWKHTVGQDQVLQNTLYPKIEEAFREGACKSLVYEHGHFPHLK